MAHRTISAEIWLYKDILYLRAYSVTVDGLRWSLPNPIHILKIEEIDKLPEELMLTFSECEFDIIDPNPRITPKSPLLSMMKMRSYRERDRKAKLVMVYLKDGRLVVDPWYFDGKGLTSTIAREMNCSLDPDDIKKTILEAFDRCHPN